MSYYGSYLLTLYFLAWFYFSFARKSLGYLPASPLCAIQPSFMFIYRFILPFVVPAFAGFDICITYVSDLTITNYDLGVTRKI
jgi:hypothetical protein